jgi:hypothetical protein
MIKEKKVLILSVVSILLFIFLILDGLFYEHTLRSGIADVLSQNFGTVLLSTLSKTTPKTATSTLASVATTTKSSVNIPPESPTNYKDNGNGTVTDNLTGLVWEKCVQGMSGTNCTSGSPALLEWAKARVGCESINLASKNDWRIPTLKELESINLEVPTKIKE